MALSGAFYIHVIFLYICWQKISSENQPIQYNVAYIFETNQGRDISF